MGRHKKFTNPVGVKAYFEIEEYEHLVRLSCGNLSEFLRRAMLEATGYRTSVKVESVEVAPKIPKGKVDKAVFCQHGFVKGNCSRC